MSRLQGGERVRVRLPERGTRHARATEARTLTVQVWVPSLGDVRIWVARNLVEPTG